MRYRLTTATLLLGIVLCFTPSAHAAENNIILTWRAGSYAPPAYTGKLLPSSKTMVALAVSVFKDGKMVSLEKELVRWYINDLLVDSGIGKVMAIAASPEIPNGDFAVRVELPNLNGEGTIREIEIPSVPPRLTLRPDTAPSAIQSLPLLLKSEPYYFNISDPAQLTYTWKVDGTPVPATENPFWLKISAQNNSVAPPKSIRVQLSATHGNSILEKAGIDVQLKPGRND